MSGRCWQETPGRFICHSLRILRLAQSTVFPVTPEEAERLEDLWRRTGVDWGQAESAAALLLYDKLVGQEISKKPDSPVADLALTLGRAVTGVYNKLMNFRSLDPRDPRAGMSGVGEMDRSVWQEYYDPATSSIRRGELEAEVHERLSGQPIPKRIEELEDAFQVAEDSASQLTPDELERLANAEGQKLPAKRTGRTTTFTRSARVAAWAKVRANHRCEIPGCPYEPFRLSSGALFAEVHHIIPLGEGGPDTANNVACLCPSHHREIHLGARSQHLTDELVRIREIEAPE